MKAWFESLVSVSVSAIKFWYWNRQYRPFHLVVSVISGIAWVISSHIDSVVIKPKSRYRAIFQILLERDN